jgi:outer membrane protein W
MKKIFLLFAFAALFSIKAQAQAQLGLHAGIGLPDFGTPYSLGIGGGGNFKYLLNDNFALGANVSYYTFGAKSEYKDAGLGAMNLVPIHANAEYYFGDGSTKPFIGADLGVTLASNTSTFMGQEVSGSSTNFSFAPIVGVKFGLGDSVDLFGNAKYNVITGDGGSTNYVGINFGLLFNLGN